MNRSRALFLLVSLLYLGETLPAQTLPECESSTEPVRIRASVWLQNPKTFLRGMRPEHFAISSRKTPIQLTCFSDLDQPISVAFLIDFSSSIRSTDREQVMSGIRAFTEGSHLGTVFTLVGFSNEAFVLMEPSLDRGELERALTKASSRNLSGRTAFFDGISLALKKLQSETGKERILIAFSDADDNYSSVGALGSIKDEFRKSGARVFVFRKIDSREGISQNSLFRDRSLSKLLAESQGALYSIDLKTDLTESLKKFSMRLKSEYILGFTPQKRNAFQAMEVSVKTPDALGPVMVSAARYFYY